jgi:hypothetical protein
VREPREQRRAFCLNKDLGRLAVVLDEIGDVALIIIDPITAYLGDTDSHRNAEVRAVLAPLAELAARYGAAVIAVSHLRKSEDGDAILRVTGSLAFVAAARAAYLITADPDTRDRRLFLPAKNNLASDMTGYAYRVEPYWLQPPGIPTCRAAWEPDAVNISADEALSQSRAENPRLDDAMVWLGELLAGGPRAQTEVQKGARVAGHAWATVRRAAKEIGVAVAKDGFSGPWMWSLGGTVSPDAKLDAAMVWLGELLAGGPRAQAEVQAAAQSAGHAWPTVRRAATELEIVVTDDANGGGRVWSFGSGVVLPAQEVEL